MNKDFWYLYFMVIVDDEKKYFINYRRAHNYYHSLGDISKTFRGMHLFNGIESFHTQCMYPAFGRMDLEKELLLCQEYYDAEL